MGKTGKRPTKPKGNGHPTAAKKPTPGCYVLSLSVENIRCFGPKQTLDCSDGGGRPKQWTVILGDNGTGKTTLLRMFDLCRSTSVENWNRPTDARLASLLSAVSLHAGRGNLGATPTDVGTVVTRLDGKKSQNGYEVWRRDPTGNESTVVDSITQFCYDVDRKVTKDNSPLLIHFGERPPQRTQTGDVVRDAADWLIALDYSANKSGNREQVGWLELAQTTILKILNYGDKNITKMRCQPGTGPNPQSHVEFKTADGWLPLRQLGHGYQTMIAWMVDFVSRMVERYPDSADPLAEPAVCLVDEIDLHLHPVWQRKVIGYLSERFPNTQFIVTAHSPLVVQAAASANANIAVLVRSEKPDADGNHYVEIRNNPEDVRNWRLDQILTSDLFGGLSLNPPNVEDLFKEKEHLIGLSRLTPAQKARLTEIDADLAKLPVGDDAREVKEMQAIREALAHLQKRSDK